MTLAVAVQPLASVAVTVYEPAAKPVAVAPVAALLQAYVFVPVPPVEVAVAEPLAPPLHNTFVCAEIDADTAVGCVIVTVADAVHPLASVAVTVYAPAANPVAVAPVAPLLQA